MGPRRLTCWLSGLGLAVAATPVAAQAPSGYSRVCPPAQRALPVYPGCEPAQPLPPVPAQPQTPSNPQQTPTTPPVEPLQLPEQQPAQQPPIDDFSSLPSDSSLALGGGDVALTPNLMGDAPGMMMQSPLGLLTAVITPGGTTTPVDPRNPNQTPTTGTQVPTTTTTVPTAVVNPVLTGGGASAGGNPNQGPIVASSGGTVTTTTVTPTPVNPVTPPQRDTVILRIPQFYRGAFKITENESPRPRTRAYISYYFYDQLFASMNPPDVPRMMLHQQVFGYEQAFLDNWFSVGVRLPYSQLVSSGFYNYTGLGDLSFVAKGVIAQRRNGDLLSGGLVVTAPTGDNPIATGVGTSRFHSTLLQPYLGYILIRDSVFFQGFSAAIVPTDDSEATVITNDWAFGWFAYRRPGRAISAIIPAAEVHINTPVDQIGLAGEPTTYFHNVTLLGTTQLFLHDTATLGFSCGAPVTGPRPFSLQAGVQFNYFF